MERRGNDFFDDTLRIGRIFDLLSHHKLKRRSSRRWWAICRACRAPGEQVVLWMVDSDQRQWRAIVEHLERRGRPTRTASWAASRRLRPRPACTLLDEARRAAQRALEHYDRDAESSRLADSVRVAVAGHGRAAGGRARAGHDRDHGREHGGGGRDRPPGRGALSAIGLLVLPARGRAPRPSCARRSSRCGRACSRRSSSSSTRSARGACSASRRRWRPTPASCAPSASGWTRPDADLRRIGDGLGRSARGRGA
jgi:hypothetical protein